MRKRFCLGVMLMALIVLTGSLSSQSFSQSSHPETVVCPECGYTNEWSRTSCAICGASLEEAKNQLTVVQQNLKPATADERRSVLMPEVSLKPATVEVGMSRIFHLRDGNVVAGTITDIERDSIAVIDAPDGTLRIPTWQILDEMVDLEKSDNTRFVGPVLSEDDYSISIKTPYGVVVVLKRDIQSMDRYYGDKKVSWEEEKQRFYPAEELIDVFLDPTAFPLQPHTIYLSGLSLGYGFTENFMLRTQFGNNFVYDLNLHPMFRFFRRTTGTSEISLALGVRLFSHHRVQQQGEKYSQWIVDTNTGKSLDDEQAVPVEEVLVEPDKKEFYWESYLVLSRRQSLPSGRGKWGWHLGAQTNALVHNMPELREGYKWDDEFQFPYRVWVAMDYDLTKKLKFLIEVFADNGHKFINIEETASSYFDFGGTPFSVETQTGDYQPVDLDFGFIYTINDAFRLGLHFQSPYLEIYWKW